MNPSPPQKRKAAPAGDGLAFKKASTSWLTRSHGASDWGVSITEGISPARRLADLHELDWGLRRNLVRCYERDDWQGARNQIGALEKCCMAQRALMP
jgi:hypothetical protein